MTPRTAAAAVTRVGLDADGLAALCPFHLVLDDDLRLVQVGALASRVVPGLVVGERLADHVAVRRPRGPHTTASLRAAAAQGQLAILTSLGEPAVTLKGQLLVSGAYVVFFGAPTVADEDDITALGLSLRDFPLHLPVHEMVLAARSQRTALAEARALADRLSQLNSDLEQRVAERTRSLTESRDRLGEVSESLQREIAERERIEADLRLAHKLEAVGQLASGIAHEINTPVQFVGDNLRFLRTALDDVAAVLARHDDLAASVRTLLDVLPVALNVAQESGEVPADLVAAVAATGQSAGALDVAASVADLPFLLEEAPRAVAESLEGTERVGTIVRAMKEFAHPDAADVAPVNLNRCVETTLIVARNEYRHVADLVTDLDPTLPAVPCMAGEINQVLLNLLVNAAHAIADVEAAGGPRGTITVSTRAVDDAVELRVADTGGGIPPSVQPRIFDPFFTTKEVGRGTGQGLAMCHSIVTVRHRGRLTFSTEVGRGTEFVVRLPLEV